MADELIAEVRAALHDEVADVTASPSLLATVRRRHRRRVLARRFGLTVPVMAAAVAATVVLAAPAPPHQPPVATSQVPEPANAAYVKDQVTDALDEVADDIVYERGIVTEGDKYSAPGEAALYERWQAADGSSFRLLVTRDGTPVVDLSYDRVADIHVDHRTRTYLLREGMDMNEGMNNDVWTPREIQRALAGDLISVLGPGEPVNGMPTVKLRSTGAASRMIMWVDATTYLPVRWQYDQDNAAPFDVTWLPPTQENQAQLTTTIPPDYRRVD